MRLAPKYIINAGIKLKISDQNSLIIHTNYAQQNPYSETLLGAMFSWKKPTPNHERNVVLYGGVFYRHLDAIIPVSYTHLDVYKRQHYGYAHTLHNFRYPSPYFQSTLRLRYNDDFC